MYCTILAVIMAGSMGEKSSIHNIVCVCMCVYVTKAVCLMISVYMYAYVCVCVCVTKRVMTDTEANTLW